jgi:hypothetical protein
VVGARYRFVVLAGREDDVALDLIGDREAFLEQLVRLRLARTEGTENALRSFSTKGENLLKAAILYAGLSECIWLVPNSPDAQ